MTKLDKLYRKVPQLESPAGLDDRVLQSARSRAPQAPEKKADPGSQRHSTGWRVGYVISYLCIFGIGLGVLLQADFFPQIRHSSPAAEDVAASEDVAAPEDVAAREDVATSEDAATGEVAQSDSEKSVPEIVVAERSSVTAGETRIQSRRTDPSSSDIPPPASSPMRSPVAIETDADTSVTMTTPAGVSRSVAGFSTSQSADLTDSVTNDSVESAALPASVASIGVTSAEVTDNELAGTDVVVNDVINNELSSAKIQALDQDGSRSLDDLPILNRQSPDAQSLMTERSVDWLLSQAPDQYTIKVAADSTASTIKLLASELSIATELVFINDTENGWLLLHGSFSNKLDAKQGLPELFAAAFSANAAVDEVSGFIKLAVVPYSVLQDLIKQP